MNSFRRLSGSGLLRAFVERRSTPRYSKAAPVPAVQCVFERLEPRILLSADVLGGIAANDLLQGDQHAELTSFEANQNLEQLIAPFLVSNDKQSLDTSAMPNAIDLADLSGLLDTASDDNATASDVDAFADGLKSLLPELGSNDALRQEIIFVDAATPDYEQLIDGIATDAADTQYLVFVLDAQRDGVAQIGEVLANYSGIDAIHLVSHGEDGAIQLGNSVLDSQAVSTNSDALTIWGQALSDGADVMIYGCNLAASAVGQAMLDSLALVTGADVAASDDLTGSAELGGDWTLEYNSGEIEAQIAFSQAMQQQWQATLAGEEYIDQFDTIAYNNSNGSELWSTAWEEGGEIDGANAGRVYIDPQTHIASDNALFIGLDRSIEREIDLSGVLNATLTFDWAHVETTVGDSVVLEIYDGSTWNTLETFVGPVAGELTDTAYNSSSHDISAFIDANTRIRFTAALQVGYSEFTIDNVAIDTSNHIEMVWVDQAAGKIQAAELDGSNAFDLITGLASPLSVAVDTQGSKVYWSDDVLNTIQRANFDGSGMETIVSSVPGTVAIDLDTVNGKIYWVEGGGGQLSRANLDGTAPESLTGSPDIPSGIAIDVANDKIYWADPGNDRIKQTTLDGIGTSNLVSSGVGNSADIALNTSTGQLYWSDDVTGTINRVDSDGTNITTVISGLGSPYGLAVDGAAGKIYWTDTTTGQLHAANLDGSDNQVIATGLTGARDVDVVVGAAVVVAANSAPIAVDDANYTTNAGQALVVDASNDLLENDSDVDADTLNTWVVNGPANGILNIDPTGLVNATVIASSTFNEDNPAWSPDGSKLAFTSDRSGFQELWVVNSDGTGLTQVTTHGAVGVVVGGPAWTPDGSQLYFHSNLSGGDNDIYVIDAATTGIGTQLSTGAAHQIQPSVSPDGSTIAFASDGTSDYEINIEPAGGGANTQLTFNSDNDRNPVWSPDGSTLLFTSNRLGGNFGIYEYDIASTTETLITTTAGNDRSPEYSPDGSKIIFHSNVDGDNEIFVYNKATTVTTQLTNNSPTADTNATWSPDGTKIVYVSEIGGNKELVVASLLFDGTFDYIPNAGYNGVDTFTYKATDGSADSNLATATITVNTAPNADAGGPYTINEGDSLVLDASASSDPETTPTYTWDIDGDGQYDDASGVNPTVTWASLGAMSLPINDDGPYTVEVRVDDGMGGVTTDSVTLTVNNVAPILSTTGTGSATEGLDYTLNLSAIDPGDDIISSWTINWGDGSIETIAGNPTSVAHTYLNPGFTYNILASAVDEDGTHMQNQLLVANSGDNSLSRFGPDAEFLQQFGTGDSAFPVDIIVGPDGNLYVSGWDSDDVLRYNATTGVFIDTFVPANTGGLDSAAGLAFGPDGHLYVASRLSGEVLRFDASNGNFLGAFVATATSGGLTEPEGITFGPDGDLYVSDYDSGEVYKYDGTTGVFDSVFVTTADNGGLVTPEDLTFGPDGNLYIASDDGSSVLRFNGSTGAFIDEFIASGSNGLTNAVGITFGPDGNLYVASWDTSSVLRFNGTSGAFIDVYISTVSGTVDNPDYLNFIPEHQVTVASSNIDPTLDNAIADQSATERMPFSFTVDANAFSDADLDTLVYSAQLADSSPLPGWLNFDAASRTFSGTPLHANIGTLSVQVIAGDGEGGTPASDTFDIVVAKSSTSTLWLSTQDAATDNNLDVINEADIASFGNPDLVLELGDGSSGVTDGTFFTEYSLPENVRAMHYVNKDVTVDTYIGGVAGVGGTSGTRLLEAGQIVLSMRAADTNDFTVDAIGGGTITVNNTDILVYDPNEGTSGAFAFLIEDAILQPDNSAANIHAVSIVEETMTVGVDTELTAGTYLIARSDADVHADISTYTYASGLQDFLLGTEFLSSPADQVQGIEIISATSVNLGGVTLTQGMLLVSVETNQVVGTTALASVAATAQNIDVIALDIKATEQDTIGLTNVDANIIFDGSDIGLSVDGSLEINGLTVYVANNAPTGGVTISGSAVEDSVLSAADTLADEDGLGTITYQWLRDGVEIAGATGVNYTLGDPDVGSTVTVEASYTDGAGKAEFVESAPTAPVAGINDAPTLSNPGSVFINEIHYDNAGVDFGEGIEIAGVAGTSLNGWSLVLYNGFDGSVYHTEALTGFIPSETAGFGAVAWVPGGSDQIQNGTAGNPDGIALVDNRGNVVQFLSYEGTFTALEGPAAGMLSTDIGVQEGELSTAPLTSLQLKGTGTTFSWSPSSLDSFGTLNTGQNVTALAIATHRNVLEDGTLVFSTANGNSIDIADPDDGQDPLAEISVQLNANRGTLTLGDSSGLKTTAGVGTSSVTITGSVSAINNALEGLSYKVDQNYYGAAQLGIWVDDQGNSGSGGDLQTGGVVHILVAPQPDDPTLDNAISDQLATEANLFSFTFASNTFGEVDGDALTYSAKLSNGSALPGWLTFTPGSRTFFGTPLNADVGSIEIEVTADDGQGGTPATDIFKITVGNINNDPTLDNSIPDQSATEDSAFSFVFDANTFSDADLIDSITYSAKLSNGDPLPGWLTFTAADREFSGTPLNSDVGTLSIEVTADDSRGGTPATDTFTIAVGAFNNAPTFATTATDPAFVEGNSAVKLFSGSSIDLIEAGQKVKDLTFTVDGLQDGNSEILKVDGKSIKLVNGSSGTTVVNGLSYTVSIVGATATLDFTGGALTSSEAETLIDSVAYKNSSTLPSSADRVVSITAIQDDGGTDNLGSDTVNPNINSTVSVEAANELWLSTDGDVSSSGAPGQNAWADSSVLGFYPSVSGFEPATNGVFDAIFDIEKYTSSNTNIDAIHYVTTDIDIGSGTPVSLLAGDVLFSLDSDETLAGNNSILADKSDVFVFRPDTPGNFSSGSFTILFSNPNGKDITGITLVEEATQVGDATLQSGTFLFTQKDAGDADFAINIFTPGDLSVSSTNGTVNVLVDGKEEITLGEDIFQDKPVGIELVENQYTIGGTTLQAGTILLTMDGDKGIWADNNQAGTRQDIYALHIDRTTLVNGSTAATASLLFEGNDVFLDADKESLDALSFTQSQGGDADPVLINAIPDQGASENTAFAFTFTVDAFNDPDGNDSLSYSALLADGSALPTWLNFDASTRTFSGTPLNADVGFIDVEVTADDGNVGTPPTDTFRITIANANNDPTLDNAIADQPATEDSAFSFTFNANTFGDVDAGASLTYTATLSGGGTLPSWLNFDAGTRTFSGTPLQADVGTLSIEVSADDGQGGTAATDSFNIVVSNSNDAPVGSVSLSSTSPKPGDTISSTISLSDEDGLGAFSYQWQRAGVDIAGATSSTYVVAAADAGSALTLVVSYTDGLGKLEKVTSSNTAFFIPSTVEPAPPTPESEPEPEPEIIDSGTPPESEEPGDPEPETMEPPVEPGFEAETDETVTVFEPTNDEAAGQINAAIDESTENEVDEPIDYKEKEFSIAQVSFNLVRLQSEYTPYNDPLTLVQFGGFVDAINQMREDIIEASLDNAPVVGSTFAVSAGMSAGYVAWLARSGAVLGSVMSAMPMWRFIDPLPVLNKLDDGSEDEESLEAIIENSEKNSAAANVAAEAAVDVDVDSNRTASDKIEKPGAAPDSTH